MSSGVFFFIGALSSVSFLLLLVVFVVWRRGVRERQFAEALMLADSVEERQPSGRDLLSLTSAMSYGLLLRQAFLERCEGIEDDDERESFVDDLVEIAEAYGDGLVKRSKSLPY